MKKGVTMAQSKLVLVTGATGKQGGACVEALLTRGHQVRALTRNSASPAANRLRERGVEITIGDFSDRDSLIHAARGVDVVYAMSTPYEQGAEKETAQGITITDAAKAARVGHFVYSSVASANRGTGIEHFDGKYAVEKHLQASGMPYTIVAPVFFMENLLQPWTLPSLRQGKLTMALPASRPFEIHQGHRETQERSCRRLAGSRVPSQQAYKSTNSQNEECLGEEHCRKLSWSHSA